MIDKEDVNDSSNLIQLKDWLIVRISGPDAVSYLNGLTTRDLDRFSEEEAYLSAFLNPKGKITSLYWLIKTQGEFALNGQSILMIIPPEMKDNAIQDLLKYNINVDVKLEDVTQEFPLLYYSPSSDGNGFPNRDPMFFLPEGRFNFLDPNANYISYDKLLEETDKFVPFSIFIGLNPLESGLKTIVDLQKGCFLGQEPISRMTFRGRPRFQLVKSIFPCDQLTLDGEMIFFDSTEVGKTLLLDSKKGILIWQLKSRSLEENIYQKIVKETQSHLLGTY